MVPIRTNQPAGAPRGAPPGRQKGQVAVFAAISLVALVVALVATLDLGRTYFAHRNLQRMADMAALDAARRVSGCQGVIADPADEARQVVLQSLAQNDGLEDYLQQGGAVRLGRVVASDGIRRFEAGDPWTATAVQVELRRPLPPALGGLYARPDRQLVASATARSNPVAGLSLGTALLDLSLTGQDTILNALLNETLNTGTDISLSVLDYQTLAGASVTLGELLDVSAAVNSDLRELLALQMSRPALLGLVVEGLADAGNNTVATTLDVVASAAQAVDTVALEDFLQVADGSEEAVIEAPINVLDLLMALAQTNQEGTVIDLAPSVSLPLIGSVDLRLRLGEGPDYAFGPPGSDAAGQWHTVTTSASGLIEVNADLLDIDLGLITTDVNLDLYVTMAQATAALRELQCARRGQPQHEVTVEAQPGLATIGVGRFDDLTSASPTVEPSEVLSVSILGIPVRITAAAEVALSSPPQSLVFDGPFVSNIPEPSADNTRNAGVPLGAALDGALAGLADNLVLTVNEGTALGALLSGVLNGLSAVLGPALQSLDFLLQPLLSALGVGLGSAEVTVTLVEVDQPAVVVK